MLLQDYDPGESKDVQQAVADSVGPLGNQDGSRADIEELVSEFVDFGGDPGAWPPCGPGQRLHGAARRGLSLIHI